MDGDNDKSSTPLESRSLNVLKRLKDSSSMYGGGRFLIIETYFYIALAVLAIIAAIVFS